MADPAPSQPCSRCGAEILLDDLTQGLAVRLDGVPVCPSCVDSLPVVAQVAINRLRALRGLPTTTFRVSLPRHPRTNAFSFTTAGNQLLHRRQLLTGKEFTAPLLLPVAKPQHPADNPAPRKLAPLLLGMGGGVVVAGIGAVFALSHFAPTKPATAPTPQVQVPRPAPAPLAMISNEPLLVTTLVVERTRRDYPADALAALIAAQADGDCPAAVRERIEEEALAVADLQVRRIESSRNSQAAAALNLPDVPLFTDLRARLAVVQALAPTPPRPVLPPPPPVTVPVPVPPSAPVQPTAAQASGEPAAEPAAESATSTVVLSQIFPPAAQRLALDGSTSIPSPWPSIGIPSGLGRKEVLPVDLAFLAPVRREIQLVIPAGPAGGALLQINGNAALRAQLDGIEVGQFARPKGLAAWRWWSVALPERSEEQRLRLTIDGAGGFVLGPAVVVAGAAPDPALLRTVPAPLQLGDPTEATSNRTLMGTLRLIGEGRRNPLPPFDPAAIKVLYGDELSQGLGSGLNRRLAAMRSNEARKLVEDVPDFAAGWFEKLQLKAKPKEALAPSESFSVLVLWPGDQAPKLAAGDQLQAIRIALLEPEKAAYRERSFLLPVVVLGSAAPIEPGHAEQLEAAWTSLATQAKNLGIPVIDVRAAQAKTKTAQRDEATRLLADGLANLTWHLRYLSARH